MSGPAIAFELPTLRSFSASNALENVSDKVFWGSEAVAPLCVCGGGKLCGDNFVERFALFLESRRKIICLVAEFSAPGRAV